MPSGVPANDDSPWDAGERQGLRFRPPTASERAAITLCSTCPVRRDCAKASLTPGTATYPDTFGSKPTPFEPSGLWAGCRREERQLVYEALGAGVDAVDALLRVGERMAKDWPGDPAKLKKSSEVVSRRSRPPGQHPRTREVQEYARRHGIGEEAAQRRLSKEKETPRSKRPMLGPGPGRGHKGPIALYAAEHGVSRDTAWRRLRKAAEVPRLHSKEPPGSRTPGEPNPRGFLVCCLRAAVRSGCRHPRVGVTLAWHRSVPHPVLESARLQAEAPPLLRTRRCGSSHRQQTPSSFPGAGTRLPQHGRRAPSNEGALPCPTSP